MPTDDLGSMLSGLLGRDLADGRVDSTTGFGHRRSTETDMRRRPRKGERYRALSDVAVTVLILLKAPATGGHRAVLPTGSEVIVEENPPPFASAVSCRPVEYALLEDKLVPESDRADAK